MAGLGDMFGASLATVNGQKPRNSDRIQAGQPLNLRAAFEAAQNIPVAGDAISGGMAIYDAAKGDYGSAAMNALGVLPFVTGTFIGKGAKTWDAIKAADAEKRIAAGDDVRKVWKETGTFKGPDGHFRQEIPDNKARIHKGNVSDPEQYADVFHEAQVRETGVPLGNALFHKKAYEAYPQTSAIRFKVSGEKPAINGSYDEFGKTISITDPYAAKSGNNTESVTLHELQHAIQQREGWAGGWNPDGPYDKGMRNAVIEQNTKSRMPSLDESNPYAQTAYVRTPEEARSEATRFADSPEGRIYAYRMTAGEAEARATQARMNMNMDQRLNTYPLDSYDVPVDQLIIRGNTPIGAAFTGK